MKHAHMLMALILIALFLWQAVLVFTAPKGQGLPKSAKIGAHVMYALVILTGAVTAMPLFGAGIIPHWLIAKMVLLIVAISATVKATRQTATPNQAKIGMLIAFIAYMGILTLAFVKPLNLF